MPDTTTTTSSAANPGMLTDWYADYMKQPPSSSGYTAAQAGTTEWKPDAQSTVQGQLTGLLATGSPMMQQAETRAKQQANERGLLNSSIAVGAGQSALYDAALPIASQDASTFAKAGEFNAGAKNTAALANAGFANDASRFTAGANNDALTQQRAAGIGVENIKQQGQVQQGLQQGQQAFTASQAALDRTQQTSLADKNIAAQQSLQKTQQDFSAAQAALDRAQQTAMTDKSLSAQQALQKAQQDFEAAQANLNREATTARDAQLFQNRLTEISAQADAAIRQYDAQNGTNLYQSYRQTSQQTYDAYISAVQQIQTSDMDANVKEAQIANLQQMFTTRQDFINTMYSESPKWADDWSQFDLSFGNS